jgi:voltage-gated potassium channel
LKNVLLAITLSLLVLVGGTLGYHIIEGWDLWDSFYMTVITVTTVGYGETNPLGGGGRIFTVILIFTGVGTVLYVITLVTQVVVGGQLQQMMGRRNLERQLRSLEDHYIICGYGRIGQLVTQMLLEQGLPLVVIEKDELTQRRLMEEGIKYVEGSATEDEVLFHAGIEKAKGLVATVSSDADNVYITLTAKGIRPDLFIIARATRLGSEMKLKRAGADKVVSPYYIGARRIAQTVLRPSVADFVELTYHSTDKSLRMEELKVGRGTKLDGVALKDSGIRANLDLIIMAVRTSDGQMMFNPSANTVIHQGDILVAIGAHDSLDKLGKILQGDDPA